MLVMLVSLVALPSQAEDPADAIRSAFSGYRSAILAGDGDRAVALLSEKTFDWYDEMRRHALFSKAETVQGLSLVNQMQVLMYRLRVPADELESMSPEQLVAHAVDQGWIGTSSVLRVQPGKVLSEGDVAVLHVIVDGQDAGPMFQFNRESGAWRLDLVPTAQASNVALEMAAKRQGLSDEDFMLVVMGSALGRRLGPEVWIPPRQAGP